MTILIDTHILIWILSDQKRIKSPIRDRIQDPTQDIAISIVSLWEIAIKSSLGKSTWM